MFKVKAVVVISKYYSINCFHECACSSIVVSCSWTDLKAQWPEWKTAMFCKISQNRTFLLPTYFPMSLGGFHIHLILWLDLSFQSEILILWQNTTYVSVVTASVGTPVLVLDQRPPQMLMLSRFPYGSLESWPGFGSLLVLTGLGFHLSRDRPCQNWTGSP